MLVIAIPVSLFVGSLFWYGQDRDKNGQSSETLRDCACFSLWNLDEGHLIDWTSNLIIDRQSSSQRSPEQSWSSPNRNDIQSRSVASQDESFTSEYRTDRQKRASSSRNVDVSTSEGESNHDHVGDEAMSGEIRALLHPGPIQGATDWGIPPAPVEACDPELEVCCQRARPGAIVQVIWSVG